MENHLDELPNKPVINIIDAKQVNINLARKLELKILKKDLRFVIQGLETKRGDPSFLISRLREILPKAIRIYEKTSDLEMEQLLTKTEKWI